jgi:hypothetical protein
METFLVGQVGRVKASALGCDLRLLKFLVGDSKAGFETGPSFVGNWESPPVAAGISKETSLEDGIIGICKDLGWSIGSIISGSGKINGVFVLVE